MTSQISENFLSSEFKELRFEDGGVYCGGTRRGKAHGHGVCTGPGGEGQYAGAWYEGFESSGSYVWPNGNVYYGQWMQGKRHGLGMEKRGHWVYQGEMSGGLMGKYGVKKDERSLSRYEGTWTSGVQCGYGMEVYSDEGSYVGQWLKGVRQGYGIRTSATFDKSSTSPQATNAARKFSLTLARSEPEIVIKESDLEAKVPPSITDLFPPVPPPSRDKHHVNVKLSPVNRIGFFLKGRNKDIQTPAENQNSSLGMSKKFSEALKLGGKTNSVEELKGKQDRNKNLKSTDKISEEKASGIGNLLTDIVAGSNPNNLLDLNSVPAEAVEIYSGEWKHDKRCGYGVCQRSDGLKYEGEWSDNCKNGFGATTFSDGSREEGCYKNNHFQEPSKRLQMLKIGKLKEQVDSAVMSANKAAQIAAQKAEIALSRAKTAVSKMEQAIQVVDKSILDSKIAQCQLAAHLEQRKQNSAFKVHADAPNPHPLQSDGSHEIQICINKSDTSVNIEQSSKPASNLKKSESWQRMNMSNIFLHSRKCSISSDNEATKEDKVADFYDTATNLVTFSAKVDKNEIITNKCRRSTMPSIVKYLNPCMNLETLTSKVSKFETIPENSTEINIKHSHLSSFVVQNGHKRLLSSSHTISGGDEYYDELRWDEYPPKQPREKLPSYKLQEKQWMSKADIRSVPDVRYVNKWDTKVLSKKEAHNMCKKLRAEKQKLIEIERELRKKAVVIKIGEIKAWCKRHFLEFFLISVNTIMAIMFYNLLK